MPAIAQRATTPSIQNDSLAVPATVPSIPDAALKANPALASWNDDLNAWWNKTRKAFADFTSDNATAVQQVQSASQNIKISSNGFTALISTERTARIDADGALAQLITTVEADYQAGDSTLSASITNEQTARVTADSALASSITALSASFTSALATTNAAIVSEATARANADSALTTSLSSLTATVTTNNTTLTAAITTEQTARATADSAITTSISTLSATVTTNNTTLSALITAEQTARITQDGILAGAISTLTATSGNHVFLQASTSVPSAGAVGDLWYQTDNGDKLFIWNGTAWVDGSDVRIGSTAAAVSTETSARISGDTSLATSIASVLTIANGNTAAITTETTARTNADTALTNTLSTLSATVTSNNSTLTASITAEQTARANADTALSNSISTLAASSGNHIFLQASTSTPSAGGVGDLWYQTDHGDKVYIWNGSAWVDGSDTRIATTAAAVTTEQTARTNADTSLATSIASVLTIANGNTASITAEQTARTNADTAITNSISTLNSTVTSNNTTVNANITAEQTARSNADTAITTSVSNLTSTVTSNNSAQIASISTEASTRATAISNLGTNLSAKYTLTVSAGNVVTGMNITSASGPGTNISAVTFNAADFKIYNTSTSTGVAPFQVSGGVVTITGSLIIHPADIQGTAIVTGGAAHDVNVGSTTINGNIITSGTVNAIKIGVTDLASINSNLGAITAGSIVVGTGNQQVTLQAGKVALGNISMQSTGTASDMELLAIGNDSSYIKILAPNSGLAPALIVGGFAGVDKFSVNAEIGRAYFTYLGLGPGGAGGGSLMTYLPAVGHPNTNGVSTTFDVGITRGGFASVPQVVFVQAQQGLGIHCEPIYGDSNNSVSNLRFKATYMDGVSAFSTGSFYRFAIFAAEQ